MEQGTLADWYSPSPTESFTNDHGGGEYDSGGGGTNGDSDASSDYAHGGTWSAKQVIDTSNGASPGTRMIRVARVPVSDGGAGSLLLRLGLYPAARERKRLVQPVPVQVQDAGQQLCRRLLPAEPDEPQRWQPLPAARLGLGRREPELSARPVRRRLVGREVVCAGEHGLGAGRTVVRVVAYVVPSSGYQGKMMFWEDNGSGPTLIYDFENVLTGYPNTNSVNGVDTQWGVNAYANGLSPAVYSQYIDDAAISLNE